MTTLEKIIHDGLIVKVNVGFQIRGKILRDEGEILVMETKTGTETVLVFKESISTIMVENAEV